MDKENKPTKKNLTRKKTEDRPLNRQQRASLSLRIPESQVPPKEPPTIIDLTSDEIQNPNNDLSSNGTVKRYDKNVIQGIIPNYFQNKDAEPTTATKKGLKRPNDEQAGPSENKRSKMDPTPRTRKQYKPRCTKNIDAGPNQPKITEMLMRFQNDASTTNKQSSKRKATDEAGSSETKKQKMHTIPHTTIELSSDDDEIPGPSKNISTDLNQNNEAAQNKQENQRYNSFFF